MIKKILLILIIVICSGIVMAAGIDDNTIVMLHGEDATDSSSLNNGVTLVGDAQSVANGKFDNAFSFDGDGDRLIVSDVPAINSTFTVDFWLYLDSLPASRTRVFTVGNSYMIIFSGAPTQTTVSNGANSINFQNPPTGVWTHIAVVVDAGAMKCYYNGVLVKTHTDSNWITRFTGLSSPMEVDLSGRVADRFLNGYIDEFRISQGVARWTSDFSSEVPNAPYSAPAVPIFTEFASDGDTTDFSTVDVSAVDDPVLADTNVKVEWKGTLNLDGADLDSAVDFSSNFVNVDSVALAALNTVANITLKDVSYDSVDVYYVTKDGSPCGDCIKYSANPVKFEVSGFSNYTTGGNLTGIPEFSTMTLGVGLVAVLIGLVLIRRKNKFE